jgi:hypothetical protein
MICSICNNQHGGDEKYSEPCPKCIPYIPIDECKNSHLYIIKARNASIGVYKKEDYSFQISRFKFTSNYIFGEYHWDIGNIKPDMQCYGTAKPFHLLEELPIEWLNDEVTLIGFLNKYYEDHKQEIKNILYKNMDENTRKIYMSCDQRNRA